MTAKKIILTVFIVLLAVILLVCLGFGIWVASVTSDAKLNKALLPTSNAQPVFYDKDGKEILIEKTPALSPEDIPKSLSDAFVAIEDKRFYEHKGVDYRRVFGAIVSNLKSKSLKEGASTITQQLVKNTHLTQEKSLKRKLNEMAIAKEVEKNYSKAEIMAMYLSVIYFGAGLYGVRDAAALYFGKDLNELTVAQCATLAGIIKNPSRYSPKNSIENSTKRRNLVLSLMREQGKISDKVYKEAVFEELVLTDDTQKVSAREFYVKRCREQIKEIIGCTDYELDNLGLKVYTFYDDELQTEISNILSDRSLYKKEDTSGSAIVIDNFTSGVSAHFSTDRKVWQRQPGSTLKPISIYTPALAENVIYPSTVIKDEKTVFGDFSPKNYNDVYYGWTNVREAVKKSLNSVAVKTLTYLTVPKSIAYLNKMGIETKKQDETLSLALGTITEGITTKQLADAYLTLACGGGYGESSYIESISNRDGKQVWNFSASKTAVFDEASCSLMTDMLLETAKSGTAKSLSTLPFEVASKTGTASVSGRNTDAVNASYTSEHTVVVWHYGKDIEESGGQGSTISARKIYEKIYRASHPFPFVMSCDVVSLDVDLYSLEKDKSVKLAGVSTPQQYRKAELFKKGNTPKEVSTVFDKIKLDDFILEADTIKGVCKIKFDAKDIYSYDVYRVLKVPEKIATVKDKSGQIVLEDFPSGVGVVIYEIVPYIENEYGLTVGNTVVKKAFIK